MRVKQLNLDNFAHAATGQTLLQVLIAPLRQREITPSIRQGFFRKSITPSRKRRERKFLMPLYLRIFLIHVLKSTLIYSNSTFENYTAIEFIQNKFFSFFFFVFLRPAFYCGLFVENICLDLLFFFKKSECY